MVPNIKDRKDNEKDEGFSLSYAYPFCKCNNVIKLRNQGYQGFTTTALTEIRLRILSFTIIFKLFAFCAFCV